EGVEAPVVEVDGGHDIGDVALWHSEVVQEVPVRAVEVTEPGEATQAPRHHDHEGGRGEHEHHPTNARVHRCPPRILARLSRIIRGRATAPMTTSERATSGAWSTKNRMAS